MARCSNCGTKVNSSMKRCPGCRVELLFAKTPKETKSYDEYNEYDDMEYEEYDAAADDEDYDENDDGSDYGFTERKYVDGLTGVYDRRKYAIDFKAAKQKDMIAVYVDVNNLKKTNDTLGHKYGDILITAISSSLRDVFPGSVYRIGGDEFVVILNGVGEGTLKKKLQRFEAKIAQYNESDEDDISFEAALGYAVGDGIKTKNEILEEAEAMMYSVKKKMKASSNIEQFTDPSIDPYYNDILPEVEDELNHTVKEIVIKVGMIAVGVFAVIVWLVFML